MPAKNLTTGVVWCKYHCATCECCFRSLAAFDFHRTGSHAHNTRRCADPAKVKRRVSGEPALTSLEGRCKLGTDHPVVECEIWKVATDDW